jgi:hypothetical protein
MTTATRKKALAAAFVSIAGRVPGVDHLAEALDTLPVDAKDRARKRALLTELVAVDGQLRASSRRIRKVADAVERLAVQPGLSK